MESLDVIEANIGENAPVPRWKRRQQRQLAEQLARADSARPVSIRSHDDNETRSVLERSNSAAAVLRERNQITSPSLVHRKRSRSTLPSPASHAASPRCDRFIPDRSAMDLELGRFVMTAALGRSITPGTGPAETLESVEGSQASRTEVTVERPAWGSGAFSAPEHAVHTHELLDDRANRPGASSSSPTSSTYQRSGTLSSAQSWASSLDTFSSIPSTADELTGEWQTSDVRSPARLAAAAEKIHAPGAVDPRQLAQSLEYRSQLASELGTAGLLGSVIDSPSDEPWQAHEDTSGLGSRQTAKRGNTAESMPGSGTKILAFKPKPPVHLGDKAAHAAIAVVYTQNRLGAACRRHLHRHIPSAPERILDAPEMVDDYYLNLLDWSANNVLAVALGSAVYLWNASTGGIEQLTDLAPGDQHTNQDYVCSLKWVQGSGCAPHANAEASAPYLAVGTAFGHVQIWDVEANKRLRTLRTHQGRVGSLHWNGPLLCSGSRDSTVQLHDVREARHLASTLVAHEQEVCGLQWSPNGMQLATGGNDNLLMVWDRRALQHPRLRFDEHTAAVKALGWCPWQSHLLASGGGTTDRMLRFWNTHTGVCLQAVDTESQVCALQWSMHYRELVTGHGFSRNQLVVWKYPDLNKVAELTGHGARVLHLTTSPDGQTVASAAADETLRFWKIFPKPQTSRFGVGKALLAGTARETLVPEDTRQLAHAGTASSSSSSQRSHAGDRSASATGRLPFTAMWKSLGSAESAPAGDTDASPAVEGTRFTEASASAFVRVSAARTADASRTGDTASMTTLEQLSSLRNELNRRIGSRPLTTMRSSAIR
ncbi:cell cycle switch protein [Cyanidioschyzon merolae strain 10D]|jgi:cell division cycle protein 20 (cofactor of APC complex)|uniref:Cell cycle switch protein n=1 Tax=Cyanidioschyzon merolae (strain NIES-3377 / 10D) TaxID=280699 RepID=M1UN83_CYAM1|nr:cell cycle switch protein [Cyanidioschyzon merolae strain 10D]BAM78826.1 cell cycle switch protein [Cyanidioschyzon merolae strain 10D]|eukprot:XP_005535112.1 cell cycle switch protein [Cyanidioschyzon merolae strain 10D]